MGEGRMPSESNARRRKSLRVPALIAAAFLLLSALLIVLDAVLLRQNTELKTEVHSLLQLQPGSRLTTLSGLDAKGRSVSVEFKGSGPDTLILAFSAECGPCKANWPNWDALLRSVRPSSARVVAIRLWGELPSSYIARHHLDRTILVATPTADEVFRDNLRSTPETILAGPSGVVRGAWVGALTPKKRIQLLQLLRDDVRKPAGG